MSNKLVGFTALKEVLDKMRADFGVQESTKNVLVPAAKKAMRVVLKDAKNNLVPDHGLDTGQLKRTLRLSARATKRSDFRSLYVRPGDVVIATVSAKLVKNYIASKTGLGGIKNVGDVSDARAIAVEFGTKNRNKTVDIAGLSKRSALALQREMGTVRTEPRPYLRPALEKNYPEVIKKLGDEILIALEKYKAKTLAGSS